MPIAFLFPGQGRPAADAAELVAAERPDLLEPVRAAAGADVFDRAGESTRFAQPAIFCASLAGRERLDATAAAHLGHSLGELTAFVAAGAISEPDGIALVALRGRLMAEAPAGTMVAALGGDPGVVAAIASDRGVTVANDNGPGQLVLSGPVRAARAAAEDLREAGVRAIELGVSGAFHSPLMAPAVAPFAAALERVDVRPPLVPVWSCVTAAPVEDPPEIRRVLAQGLTAPVRFRETVEALLASGIDDFAETGPGAVLTKLIGRIVRTAAHV